MCHSFLPVFNSTSDVFCVLQKSYARQMKQDACTGVHSAYRREKNGHNLDICVLRRLRLTQRQMQEFLGLTAVAIEVFLKCCINSFAHKNKLIWQLMELFTNLKNLIILVTSCWVWVIVECRVSRLGGRGRGFEVEVEVKKSRSRLKSRGRGFEVEVEVLKSRSRFWSRGRG